MNRQKTILLLVALALMGGGALVLVRLKTGQKLGEPGIRTSPIPGSLRLRVELPEKVLDYKSEWIEQEAVVTNSLPKDTSFGQRSYTAPDGFQISMNVVLMGSDRTSIHKPEFCLRGGGWQIDTSERETIPIARPHPYELPVIRKMVTRQATINGQSTTIRGLYVYWFVADQTVSGDASGVERMWSMAQHLLTTGVLQRWAYIACFAGCYPGQEEATFERMKQFITAAVPEFHVATIAAAPADAAAPRRPSARTASQ